MRIEKEGFVLNLSLIHISLQRVNLLEKKSAKSDCMTPMVTLCVSRPLPGRAKMMT